MNKNVEKTMSRALSATLALGVVSTAIPVSAKTATSYYNDAKKAVATAKSKKTQTYIDKASKAIATLKAKTSLDNTAKVKALVSDLNKVQSAVYTKVSSAISKFKKSQNKADYTSAKNLITTLTKSTSKTVVSKGTGYQKSLDAARATVKSVTAPAAQTVAYGTTADKLKLPTTVNVTLSNGSTTTANVKWDTTKFDSAKTDKQTLTGTLTAPTTKYYKVGSVNASIDVTVGKLNVKSLTAVGAKSLKVTFDGAVTDTSKVSFAVKKGTAVTNLTGTATWNADKTEATLTTSSKLTAGTYTVTASGADLGTATADAKADNEKVSKIQVLSDKAALVNDTSVQVGYKIENQYGEDATKTFESSVQFTSSKGSVDVHSDGRAVISTGTTGAKFTKDEKFTLTVIDASTNTYATQILTVSDAAAVSDVSISGLYNENSKEVLDENADLTHFYLKVDAKDQYGSEVAAGDIGKDVIVTSTDLTQVQTRTESVSSNIVPKFDTKTIDGVKTTVLELQPGTSKDGLKAGTYTITIYSKTTAKKASFDVVVAEKSKTDTISLSAPDVAVAGEKVEVPFTVTDQKGNALTKYSDLNGQISFSTSDVKFVKDYATGNAKLIYDATGITTATKTTFTATTKTGKVAVLTLDLKAAAYPSVVSGLDKTLVTNVAEKGSFVLNKDKVVVSDQYDRSFDLTNKLGPTVPTKEGQYQIIVEKDDTANQNITLSAGVINASTTSVTVTGAKQGSAGVTIRLQKSVTQTDGSIKYVNVDGSDYSLNVNVSDKTQFASYEVGDLTPIFNASGSEDLSVYGVKADGTKVKLPSDAFTVTSSISGLSYNRNTGKLETTSVTVTDHKDVTGKITVVIDADGNAVTVDKNVTVTDSGLQAVSGEWRSTGDVNVNNGVLEIPANDLSGTAGTQALTNALYFKDQFGVEHNPDIDNTDAKTDSTVTFTNLNDANPTSKTGAANLALVNANENGKYDAAITGAEDGDTFTITVVVDGKAFSMPVVVTSNVASSLTASAAPGATDNTTAITVSPATPATSGNTYKYLISDSSISKPNAGDVAPTTAKALTSGSDITGVDASNNKYVGVYEVDKEGKVVGFKLITLTAADIKVPDTTAPKLVNADIDAADKVVTLTFDENLVDNTASPTALTAAITFAADGTTFNPLGASDTVAVTGKTIVITFNAALTGTANTVKVAADTVKDAAGNKIVATTTSAIAAK